MLGRRVNFPRLHSISARLKCIVGHIEYSCWFQCTRGALPFREGIGASGNRGPASSCFPQILTILLCSLIYQVCRTRAVSIDS